MNDAIPITISPKTLNAVGYKIIEGKRVWLKRQFNGQWRVVRSAKLLKELEEKYPLKGKK